MHASVGGWLSRSALDQVTLDDLIVHQQPDTVPAACALAHGSHTGLQLFAMDVPHRVVAPISMNDPLEVGEVGTSRRLSYKPGPGRLSFAPALALTTAIAQTLAWALSADPKPWYPPPPPARVQRTAKSSKNTVRTGKSIGDAVRYSISSVPDLGAQFMRSQHNIYVRWTRDSLGHGGGGGYKPRHKPLYSHGTAQK